MRWFVLTLIILTSLALFGGILEDYVKAPYDVRWFVMQEETLEDGSLYYVLSVETQEWKGITWINRVGITIPSNLEIKDHVILLITGGFESREDQVDMAKAFKAPFVVVGDIPNQPLFGLSEDDLIAYTFSKYEETGEKDWPLLLPMVKSVVECFNVVQEFLRDKGFDIKGYVPTGASKRGWTTWLVSTVDPRVVGIIPIVFDNLNFQAQMKHQLDMWGDFSYKIGPYTERGYPQKVIRGEGKDLLEIVDPYSYLSKLTVPKLIVVATNDRYWPIDAATLYFYDLPGSNYLLYVPNERHSIKNVSYVVNTASVFFRSIVEDGDFVDISWRFEDDGRKLVVSCDEAKNAYVWITRSKTTDFRDSMWFKFPMKRKGDHYEYTVNPSSEANICYFGEIILEKYGVEFSLSTIVRVLKGK